MSFLGGKRSKVIFTDRILSISSSSLTQLSVKSPFCVFLSFKMFSKVFFSVAGGVFGKGAWLFSLFFVFQLEGKVQQGERDFEQISKTIRKEVSRFEVRAIDGCSPAARSLQNIQQPLLFVSVNRKKEWKTSKASLWNIWSRWFRHNSRWNNTNIHISKQNLHVLLSVDKSCVSLFQLIKYWDAFLPEAKAIS